MGSGSGRPRWRPAWRTKCVDNNRVGRRFAGPRSPSGGRRCCRLLHNFALKAAFRCFILSGGSRLACRPARRHGNCVDVHTIACQE
ncbi:hypothetical protein MDS_0337 [Ectopseudomonas mendocina NK-01]|nr:hypothetical protein MDS_0337 [Pseudomonas mendocina NK-01]